MTESNILTAELDRLKLNLREIETAKIYVDQANQISQSLESKTNEMMARLEGLADEIRGGFDAPYQSLLSVVSDAKADLDSLSEAMSNSLAQKAEYIREKHDELCSLHENKMAQASAEIDKHVQKIRSVDFQQKLEHISSRSDNLKSEIELTRKVFSSSYEALNLQISGIEERIIANLKEQSRRTITLESLIKQATAEAANSMSAKAKTVMLEISSLFTKFERHQDEFSKLVKVGFHQAAKNSSALEENITKLNADWESKYQDAKQTAEQRIDRLHVELLKTVRQSRTLQISSLLMSAAALVLLAVLFFWR